MRKSNNNEKEKVENSESVKVEKKEENIKDDITTKKKNENNNNIAKGSNNKTKNTRKIKEKENEKKIEEDRLPKIKDISKNSISEIAAEAKDNLNLQNKISKDKSLVKEEDIEINNEKLEKIKDEIKKSKKDSKEKVKNSNLRKNLVRNLAIAIIITIYFLFIDLGINSIPVTVYMLDLKTFTIFIAIISIVIFERAYKKDENYLAIHGIEMIFVGIETLLLLQLYSAGNEYFNYILLAITLGMIVYYLIKCLLIYIRYKVKGK